jgi:hypothetical protein
MFLNAQKRNVSGPETAKIKSLGEPDPEKTMKRFKEEFSKKNINFLKISFFNFNQGRNIG